MNENLAVDLAQRDCLKAIKNIGVTVYQNVCSGGAVEVPWGVLDWLAAGALSLVAVAAASMLIVLLVTTWREW